MSRIVLLRWGSLDSGYAQDTLGFVAFLRNNMLGKLHGNNRPAVFKILHGTILVVLAWMVAGCAGVPVNLQSDGRKLSAATRLPEKEIVFASYCRFAEVRTNDSTALFQPRIIVAATNAFHLLIEYASVLRFSTNQPLHLKKNLVLNFDAIQSVARSQGTNERYCQEQLQLATDKHVYVIEVIDVCKKRITDRAGNEVLFELLKKHGVPVIKPERHYYWRTGGGGASSVILLAF